MDPSPLGPALSSLSPPQVSSFLTQNSTLTSTVTPEDALILSDLPLIKQAECLFLNSRMIESEMLCTEIDPNRSRLYITAGYSLIQCLKAYMSHEDSDLQEALKQVKHGNNLTNQHRAPPAPLLSRISSFVGSVWSTSVTLSNSAFSSESSPGSSSGWGTNTPPSTLAANSAEIERIRNMTVLQRHAELLYAETLVAKALLGVILSGNWLFFLSEAFNLRTALNIYIALSVFLSSADSSYSSSLPLQTGAKVNPNIDADFRSGVYLGVGACQLILSMMPQRLLAVATIFGYSGDRERGLGELMRAGGWTGHTNTSDPQDTDLDSPSISNIKLDNRGESSSISSNIRLEAKSESQSYPEPNIGITQEGMRRPLADIALLCFHLVLSQVTYRGVDLDLAQCILDWNLKRFPDGIFYLFAQGRLSLLRSQPEKTIHAHARATAIFSPSNSTESSLTSTHPTLSASNTSCSKSTEAQGKNQTYKSLHFISHWDLALAHLSLWDLTSALKQFNALIDEGATWSKACYAYGTASCLLQLSDSANDDHEKKRGEKEAKKLLESIPTLVHKIAGKSIPIEKFIARKARKFFLQTNSNTHRKGRLLLPALELAYTLQCIEHAPQDILLKKMIPEAERGVLAVKDRFPVGASSTAGAGEDEKKYYWDDYCLAHFLLGVCWRFAAHPAVVSMKQDEAKIDKHSLSQIDAEQRAIKALEEVIEHGPKIELDHYILYSAHYELGRLKLRMKALDAARGHLKLILSSATLESFPSIPNVTSSSSSGPARKGKYSMQSAIMMRTAAALEELESIR